jgi:alpha-D-ribose 1-methylphosphonate 5-triphosphate synthase subunit PhnH
MMQAQNDNTTAERKAQLRHIAEGYFEALRTKTLAAILYDEHVTLRAPLTPGGVQRPLTGKRALHAQWWVPLEPALEGVEITIVDHYLNESLTAICTEAEITIHAVSPPVTLRVADRFTVSAEGKIIEQENHFDPRDVTNPGWQNG